MSTLFREIEYPPPRSMARICCMREDKYCTVLLFFNGLRAILEFKCGLVALSNRCGVGKRAAYVNIRSIA